MLNPQLPHDAKKRVLDALMADADPLARNALMVLVDNGRLAFLHDIQVAFHEMAAVEERILDVEVTSRRAARPGRGRPICGSASRTPPA